LWVYEKIDQRERKRETEWWDVKTLKIEIVRIDNGSERGDRGGTVNISWGEKNWNDERRGKGERQNPDGGKRKEFVTVF
jgi:hypothetical protein